MSVIWAGSVYTDQGGHGEAAQMDIEKIKARIRADEYVYTSHGDLERKADGLTLAQVEEALLAGEILESYPDTGRGESCLVVGFSDQQPVHTVCGWRGGKVVIITVYIPTPPKFVDPWTRGKKEAKKNEEERDKEE